MPDDYLFTITLKHQKINCYTLQPEGQTALAVSASSTVEALRKAADVLEKNA